MWDRMWKGQPFVMKLRDFCKKERLHLNLSAFYVEPVGTFTCDYSSSTQQTHDLLCMDFARLNMDKAKQDELIAELVADTTAFWLPVCPNKLYSPYLL